MNVRRLDSLFRPNSIAILGASRDKASASVQLIRNLLSGTFPGPVLPISGTREGIGGVLSYENTQSLPLIPDLAVVCSSLAGNLPVLESLAAAGTGGALLLDQSFCHIDQNTLQNLEKRLQKLSQKTGMRLLGPESLGFLVPDFGLNASLVSAALPVGRLAFVSQSDSLFVTVLAWAKSNSLGFSLCVSLGRQVDVNFSMMLDHLSADPATKAVLLYIETIADARAFMSAARACARHKPVLVLRPHYFADAAAKDFSALQTDHVYDAAFRRAGMVRVQDMDALFEAARTLARYKPLRAEGAVIITNGKSPGYLAMDTLLQGEGCHVPLPKDFLGTQEHLIFSDGFAEGVMILSESTAEAYAATLRAALGQSEIGCVLVLHIPFCADDGADIAKALVETARKSRCLVLCAWLDTTSFSTIRDIFDAGNLPVFERPDQAVMAYLHMLRYRRTQQMLLQSPESLPRDLFPNKAQVSNLVRSALEQKSSCLGAVETRQALAAYGVPVAETRLCQSAFQAMEAATEIGFPVALKIHSPQIAHPFSCGGVMLDLMTPDLVFEAAATMVARVHALHPEAYIEGFTVQKMVRHPDAVELCIEVLTDDVFGPVLRFGQGGVVEEHVDRAVALLPLNTNLAREVLERTSIGRMLRNSANYSAGPDMDDLCLALVQISQMSIDIAQITRIVLNPVFVSSKGVSALGGHIHLKETNVAGADRLAIRPYPRELEEWAVLKNGQRILLRPICPEDAHLHFTFIQSLSAQDLRLRFFGATQSLSLEDMPRFTQIDYEREMAFIAVTSTHGEPETLGVVRLATQPDNSCGEFAIIVRSDMQHTGLGTLLLHRMLRYGKTRGTSMIIGETLGENAAMIALARKYGFITSHDHEDNLMTMRLALQEWQP